MRSGNRCAAKRIPAIADDPTAEAEEAWESLRGRSGVCRVDKLGVTGSSPVPPPIYRREKPCTSEFFVVDRGDISGCGPA